MKMNFQFSETIKGHNLLNNFRKSERPEIS